MDGWIDAGRGAKMDGIQQYKPLGHNIFVLNMSAFYICCLYSSALQTRFFHGSKQSDPS